MLFKKLNKMKTKLLLFVLLSVTYECTGQLPILSDILGSAHRQIHSQVQNVANTVLGGLSHGINLNLEGHVGVNNHNSGRPGFHQQHRPPINNGSPNKPGEPETVIVIVEKEQNQDNNGYRPQPNNDYQPPNNYYRPPYNGYRPSNNGYQPINNGNQQPNNDYRPPENNGYNNRPPPNRPQLPQNNGQESHNQGSDGNFNEGNYGNSNQNNYGNPGQTGNNAPNLNGDQIHETSTTEKIIKEQEQNKPGAYNPPVTNGGQDTNTNVHKGDNTKLNTEIHKPTKKPVSDEPLFVPLNPNQYSYEGDKIIINAPKRETDDKKEIAESDDDDLPIDIRFQNN